MKATDAKLLEILSKSLPFLSPLYQRIYYWVERAPMSEARVAEGHARTLGHDH
jgi:hypothetical protein